MFEIKLAQQTWIGNQNVDERLHAYRGDYVLENRASSEVVELSQAEADAWLLANEEPVKPQKATKPTKTTDTVATFGKSAD